MRFHVQENVSEKGHDISAEIFEQVDMQISTLASYSYLLVLPGEYTIFTAKQERTLIARKIPFIFDVNLFE